MKRYTQHDSLPSGFKILDMRDMSDSNTDVTYTEIPYDLVENPFLSV
jgi:hypothetical protein